MSEPSTRQDGLVAPVPTTDAEVAATLRARGFPPISPTDPKVMPSLRIRVTVLEGLDALIDGLAARGVNISRVELNEFLIEWAAGHIGDFETELRSWRIGGGRRPAAGRPRQGARARMG